MDTPPSAPAAGRPAPVGEPRRVRRRPPVVPLALLALLAVAAGLRPQQLLSTLGSVRAWVLVLALVLLTAGLRRATRSLRPAAGTAISLTPAVLALGLLLVPTLVGTEVSEELEGLPPVSAGTTGSAADAPSRLRTGEVTGIGHRAEGSASLVQLPDGDLLVRLEDFSVDPGPDYRLLLVPGAGQESPGDGVELGRLKGTSGDQNYALSTSPPSGPVTVLVWCEAFGVPIAGATLA